MLKRRAEERSENQPNAHQTGSTSSVGTKSLISALFAASFLALLSANALLSSASLLALGWIWLAAFKSPFRIVMAAYLTFQWLQVTMIVWFADMYGASLSTPQLILLTPSDRGIMVIDTTRDAVLFGLAAIACISFGFGCAPGIARRTNILQVPYRPFALFSAYLGLLLVSLIAGPFVAGGFAQPIIVLGELRFLFAALLFYRWILYRGGSIFVVSCIILEVVIGFSGFFSGFRQVFFVLGVALLTLAPLHWRRIYPMLIGSIVLTVSLGAIWTAIKSEYRVALNAGTKSQVVTLDLPARWQTLENLAKEQSFARLEASMVSMASRIEYVDYTALAMRYVPAVKSHTWGEVWGVAAENLFVPRLLFPDKPILPSDSEMTMRYTGLRLASGREGTSISIGYAGDTYIDFGIIGSLLLFVVLGFSYGQATAFVIRRFTKNETGAAAGAAIVMLSMTAQFEMSSVKLLAGFMWSFIVTATFAALVWPSLKFLMIERQCRASTDIAKRFRRDTRKADCATLIR